MVGVLTGVGTRKSLEHQQPVIILDSVADLTAVMYSWMRTAHRLELSQGFYRCFRGLSKKFYNFAERYEIKPAQLAAIQKLRVKDGLTISELAEEMMLHINTSSELISRMEKEGLVRKEKSDEDKRVTKVYLTENGRLVLNSLTSFSKEIEDFLEQHLSCQEMIIQSQILQKLAKLVGSRKCRPGNLVRHCTGFPLRHRRILTLLLAKSRTKSPIRRPWLSGDSAILAPVRDFA
jgi:DNA-binding MarR family transcriptional regulator